MIQADSGRSVSSEELTSFSEPLSEMPFLEVQRYLRHRGIAVPEVYAAQDDLVLLEDLGDRTLWEAAREAAPGEVRALYRAAIDELVALEAAGELHPDPSCIAFRQRFDARLFEWEFEHFLEYGLTGRTAAAGDIAALRRRFAELAEELATGPVTLAHRDYHSWNLFIAEGRIRVIDFQDALLAPIPYDLATLLNDRATPRVVTPPLEGDLLRHFLRRRRELLGDETPEELFWASYDRLLFQKSLKIVGRFHYLEAVKGKRGYVAMLPDTFATLRRCLDRQRGLEDLRRLLRRSFPEIG
jgi:hypothetical protein